jgi:hypothetical protein
LLLAAFALVVLGAVSASADTGAGTGVGTSSNTDGGHTVTGSGTFALTGGNTLTVAFECTSAASVGAVSTSIHPPASGGCYLERNATIVAYANGTTLVGPGAVTANTATVALLNTTSLRVCWHTYASFFDGYLVQTSGCTSISVVDQVPDQPPPPPTIPPVVGAVEGCVSYTIRNGRTGCPICPTGGACAPPAAADPTNTRRSA